jgi:hypothetical protein
LKYRITLLKEGMMAEPGYEAVVYREYEESPSTGDQPVLSKKAFSVAQVYTKVREELQSQSAFRVVRIEEIPTD